MKSIFWRRYSVSHSYIQSIKTLNLLGGVFTGVAVCALRKDGRRNRYSRKMLLQRIALANIKPVPRELLTWIKLGHLDTDASERVEKETKSLRSGRAGLLLNRHFLLARLRRACLQGLTNPRWLATPRSPG